MKNLYSAITTATRGLIEQAICGKPLMHPAVSRLRGNILSDDQMSIDRLEILPLGIFQEHCFLEGLLWEPERVHVLCRIEHVRGTGALGGHQLEKPEHRQTVVAVGEVGGVIAAGTVHGFCRLFQLALLAGVQGQDRKCGIQVLHRLFPDCPATGGCKPFDLPSAALLERTGGQDRVLVGQPQRPEEIELEIGILLSDHHRPVTTRAQNLHLLLG
jgi:hypothetical protein